MRPRPMNPTVILSFAPFRLPVKSDVVSAAAPVACRIKSRRPLAWLVLEFCIGIQALFHDWVCRAAPAAVEDASGMPSVAAYDRRYLFDCCPQRFRLRRQIRGGGVTFFRSCRGVLRYRIHFRNCFRNLFNSARLLVASRTHFPNQLSDLLLVSGNAPDCRRKAIHHLNSAVRFSDRCFDEPGRFLRGGSTFLRQASDLVGYNGKPHAC